MGHCCNDGHSECFLILVDSYSLVFRNHRPRLIFMTYKAPLAPATEQRELRAIEEQKALMGLSCRNAASVYCLVGLVSTP